MKCVTGGQVDIDEGRPHIASLTPHVAQAALQRAASSGRVCSHRELPRSFSAVADAINELELSSRGMILAVACFEPSAISIMLDAHVQTDLESQPHERWPKVLRPH